MNISLFDDKNVTNRFKHRWADWRQGRNSHKNHSRWLKSYVNHQIQNFSCTKVDRRVRVHIWHLRETDGPTHDSHETQTLPTENSTHTNRTYPLPTDKASSGRNSGSRCAIFTEQQWTVIHNVSMNTITVALLRPLSGETATATHAELNYLRTSHAVRAATSCHPRRIANTPLLHYVIISTATVLTENVIPNTEHSSPFHLIAALKRIPRTLTFWRRTFFFKF